MLHELTQALWLKAFCWLLAIAIPVGVAWFRTRPDPQLHTKSTRFNLFANCLLSYLMHLVQARASTEVLLGAVSLLKGGSDSHAIGSYMLGQLGRPILADGLAGAQKLFGQELSILTATQAQLEQLAIQQLGVAAVHVAGTQKLITTLASGAKVVQPA